MAHSSEYTWGVISEELSTVNRRLLELAALNLEQYERVKEVYAYCNNDDTQFAKQLFLNDKDSITDPTPLQITMATELWDAAKMHSEMDDFLNNIDTVAKNRAKKLRNLS
jgi:hypothetical protein